MKSKRTGEDIHEAVRKHYGEAISRQGSCCGSGGVDTEAARRFVHLAGYTDNDTDGLPSTVTSFGCGNPITLLDVRPGQTVLDLGSGAGLDLILASKKVGPEGRVIGLDMTPEMIAVCRRNLAAAGVTNAEVREGQMERMPVADAEIDWIISNCVINLSPDKAQVFAEAFRVLKPGGRLAVADIVTIDLPEELRDDLAAWVGCIAGAVEEEQYLQLARTAGFVDVAIVDRMIYTAETIGTLTDDSCCCGSASPPPEQKSADRYAGRVASVRLVARKPEA